MKKMFLILFLGSIVFAKTISTDVLKKMQITDPNKVYIVNFFASWCTSCKAELPGIVEFNKKLIKDKNKFEIIGVDVDEELDEGIAFQKKMGLNFRVINDTDQSLISYFDPDGIPAIYYIKEGKVKKARFGAEDDIGKVIQMDLKSL
ncbi:MAG: Cytochrome C biogenesis protein [uncultured Campylobacterales bacterium]|uniref:Cytochrome C biogenesis protein n=1 Tax=uncultured Campylobacterales bacterium TaxID=352960 RepID=A0A6S6T4E9_9BACT|nr:MAG: Cytochrome C biogenesis protein [uncultured Campylobacterales bacterium]